MVDGWMGGWMDGWMDGLMDGGDRGDLPLVFPVCVCQVGNKVIFLMSFVGNRGTFTRGYKAIIMDVEFLYHLLYLIICSLGVCVHVFFYSLLVNTHTHAHTHTFQMAFPAIRDKVILMCFSVNTFYVQFRGTRGVGM